jgi:hypothetical protein
MGVAGWALLRGELWQRAGDTGLKTIYLSLAVAGCLFVYAGVSYLLGVEEMRYLSDALRRKLAGKSQMRR